MEERREWGRKERVTDGKGEGARRGGKEMVGERIGLGEKGVGERRGWEERERVGERRVGRTEERVGEGK